MPIKLGFKGRNLNYFTALIFPESKGTGGFVNQGNSLNVAKVVRDALKNNPNFNDLTLGDVTVDSLVSNGNVNISGALDVTLASSLGDTTVNGALELLGLDTYADDASAGTGGLTTGQVYQTSTGELRIKL